MRISGLAALSTFAVVVALAASAGAQGGPPRLPDGKPDLQGVWDFRTLTPLQRPEDREALLTAEEAAEIEAKAVQAAVDADRPSEVRTEPLPVGGNVGGYNNFWFDRGAGVVDDRRTSLIVDPPDGRVPGARPGVSRQATEDGESKRPVRFRVGGIGSDGPEDRGLAERCLLGFNSGPPIVPAGYNQNIQVFQTSDHVVILNEMVHDARIVSLDGRAHLPDDLGQWMGSSRGHWDGDTLVVETTGFNGMTWFDRSGNFHTGALHVVERITARSPETLLYEVTIEDPNVFTRPWTMSMPLYRRVEENARILEFRCVEFVEELLFGEWRRTPLPR